MTLIGRSEFLTELDSISAKQNKLDLSPLLKKISTPYPGKALYYANGSNPPFDKGLLNKVLLVQAKPYLDEKRSKTFCLDIRNTDNRYVGAMLSGAISTLHSDQYMVTAPIKVHFSGTAGQSFGVWNAAGVELTLTGAICQRLCWQKHVWRQHRGTPTVRLRIPQP